MVASDPSVAKDAQRKGFATPEQQNETASSSRAVPTAITPSTLAAAGIPGGTAAAALAVASGGTATAAARAAVEAIKAGDKESYFFILTADHAGAKLNPVCDENSPPPQDPTDPRARQIAFHLRRGLSTVPPPEQLEWHRAADRVIHAINHVYPRGEDSSASKFRLFYVSVFALARLTLQDGILNINDARQELSAIERDLIEDAGPTVKNMHILDLLMWAAWLSLPFLLAYIFLCHVPAPAEKYSRIYEFFHKIHVQPAVLANFMLLWLGCFLGVCLSYALRKHDFTVDDLITAEADLLRPAIRLAFAGTLAMLLVMFAVWGIVDVQVGHTSLSSVADPEKSMFAFFVGTICGISEILLPGKLSATAVLTFK
jgi:hypothetical protein